MVTGAVAIILFSIKTFSDVSGLKTEVARLGEQLESKEREIQRLETLLVPFRTITLNRYPGERIGISNSMLASPLL